jgi:hypothetical protein
VYSDPRGLLFNLLLFGCVDSRYCGTRLFHAFILQNWLPTQSGLQKHLWGSFSFGHAKPNKLVSLNGWPGRVVPDPRPGASPGAVDVPQLSDQLDASIVLMEDHLNAIHTEVSAARLVRVYGAYAYPGRARAGLFGPRSRLKGEAGHLVVVREIAQGTALTSEVLRRTADLHAQAASIEENQAFSLAEVQRVTSSLPDRLGRLERSRT